MKQKHLLTGLVLGTLLLTGCTGNVDSVTANTITIEKDGSIRDISVEDFSDGSYDMTKLEEFINAEIEEYNSQTGENRIVLDDIQTENSIVKLQLSYTGMEDYNAFNHTEYEYSSLAEAGLTGEFTSAADGSTVKAADMNDTDLKVLKIEDAMNIVCKGKILYYNSFVTEDDGTFSASGEGTAVIVLK